MKKEEQSSSKSDTNELEAKLKKQYGSVTKITITTDDKKELTAYLREPSLSELDATLSGLNAAPISSSIGLFRTVHVGGDKELLSLVDKAGYAIGVHKEIQKIIPNYATASVTL